jgi:DNA-binding transcriptional regulator WhiA
MGKTYEKYDINESIFEVLDEKSSYILGVIFSDGNIEKNNSRLCISSKDIDWLTNISYIFGNPPIKKRKNNIGEWYVLSINRKKIVKDLMKYGITENKSLNMKFPDLDVDNLRHFIRGYFDGDGSIRFDKKRGYELDFACGSEDFSKSLVNILNRYVYSGFYLYHKRKNYWNIRGFNKCWKEFSNFIYKDATIFLPRKKLDEAIVQSL